MIEWQVVTFTTMAGLAQEIATLLIFMADCLVQPMVGTHKIKIQ